MMNFKGKKGKGIRLLLTTFLVLYLLIGISNTHGLDYRFSVNNELQTYVIVNAYAVSSLTTDGYLDTTISESSGGSGGEGI